MYEQFIMQYKGAPLRTAVSAILIDAKNETVVEETWLSATPEVPSILSREVKECGDIATWTDDEIDEEDFEWPNRPHSE